MSGISFFSVFYCYHNRTFLVPYTSFWLKLACLLMPQKFSVSSLGMEEIELCDMCKWRLV